MASALSFFTLVGLLGHAFTAEAAVITPDAANAPAPIPVHIYSSFSYTQMTSNRYATPLKSPVSYPTPFAPPFSKASTLLPADVTYTTYSYNPQASLTPDGKYGQSAYAALWTNLSFSDCPPFTTTVSPTPVPTSELVFPPPLPQQSVDQSNLKLPSDFIWGVAGSAWQIEGGLQIEGRGPSLLDTIGALGTSGGSNDSNVADMNYFLYKQDIARLAALGVPYYSFSIAWSRVVPFGVAGSPVNTEALAHYDDLINSCLENGITPIVTLMHADPPPTVVADMNSMSTHFLYYAKQVMTRYGDRVPYWVTFNEPNIQVGSTYTSYNGLTASLLTHAAVYDWYKNELGGTGKITMKFANNLAIPLDLNNSSHVSAALRYQDFILGIMGNPLFLGKQYPNEALSTLGENLTALTNEQISSIHGRIDFWSFDPYVAQFAYPPPGGVDACASDPSNPLWPTCVATTNVQANGWLMGDESNAYAYIAPQYVRQQLGYVWNTFRPSGILISEFGFNPFADSESSLDAQRDDLERTTYYRDFLQEVLKSIHEDNVNVIGALAWSFVDNNEFGSFANQYGMQAVNRTNGAFTRYYKRSFFDYVDFFHKYIAR